MYQNVISDILQQLGFVFVILSGVVVLFVAIVVYVFYSYIKWCINRNDKDPEGCYVRHSDIFQLVDGVMNRDVKLEDPIYESPCDISEIIRVYKQCSGDYSLDKFIWHF